MPFTLRQRRAWPLARQAALVLGLGLLLGFAGPFGASPPLAAPVRFAFWIFMAILGFAAARAAERLLPETERAPPASRLAAVALASALPLTFVAAWAVPLVRPGHHYAPLPLVGLYGAVAAVQLVIVFTLLRGPGALPSAGTLPEPAPESRPAPGTFPLALLSRLPSRLGDRIVALEAEDHYLRVHTTLGSDLVLMRLSDAVAAIDPDLGLQVHRSWWVAHAAIGEIVRSEQRTQLRLSNGLLVPVGRTYLAAVRARSPRLTA